MGINRHNYEEFFLLYVDNELSAADRKAVELFVLDNADLKQELHLLQQTIFNADDVVFEQKHSLLKQEVTAWQQNLLLYMDDELNATDKFEVEKLLDTDAAARQEMTVLQQTKLLPDTAIVFGNKKSLYRKEGARVIEWPWRRIAAAAILLGFGSWVTVTYLAKTATTQGRQIVINEPPGVTAPGPTKNAPTIPVAQPAQSTTPAVNTATVKNTGATKPAVQKSYMTANNKVPHGIPEKVSNDIVVAKSEIKKPDNNLPKPYSDNINKTPGNEIITANVTPKNTATESIKSGIKTPVVEVISKPNDVEVNGYALTANYTEESNPSSEDNRGKKTKLGGLFRKVKRLVERNTEDPSGKGIKVAGFDIAIK